MTLQEQINAIQNSTELTDIEKEQKIWELKKANESLNYEKMFKDTQASFTRAQQEKVEMAKMLVESNPANIKNISDEKVRNKIIQEKWWVETLDQLEYIYPDYAKKPNDGWGDGEDGDVSEIEKLNREVKFMKLQNVNTKTKEALIDVSEKYGEVIKTIPEFDTKLQSELKYISEQLSPKERVEKAFKLVVNSNGSTANAFSIMQWIDNWNNNVDIEDKKDKNKKWSPLDNAFKNALSRG